MPKKLFNVVVVRSIEETVEIVVEAASAHDAHACCLEHLKANGDEYEWKSPRKDLTVWHKREIDTPPSSMWPLGEMPTPRIPISPTSTDRPRDHRTPARWAAAVPLLKTDPAYRDGYPTIASAAHGTIPRKPSHWTKEEQKLSRLGLGL
jgi:hypothetical protein